MSLYYNQGKAIVSKVLELATSNPSFLYFNAHSRVLSTNRNTSVRLVVISTEGRCARAWNGSRGWEFAAEDDCAAGPSAVGRGRLQLPIARRGAAAAPVSAGVLVGVGLILGIDPQLSIKAFVPLCSFLT